MQIRVMSWNMAGAKLLGKLAGPPAKAAERYVSAYNSVWNNEIIPYFTSPDNSPEYPDIILLQECIGFLRHTERRSGRWESGQEILGKIFDNYTTFFFPALSSYTHPHPAKWEKYRQGQAIGNYLPEDIEAQQGYGICIRNKSLLRKIWVPVETDIPEGSDVPQMKSMFHHCFEKTTLTTGAYLGNRDTEPRLAVMGRLMLPDDSPAGYRYVNFLNTHLTTLKGERTGSIRINQQASATRAIQLNMILNNVVSAYQEADKYRVRRSTPDRKEDVWIIAGDLNSTAESEEVSLLRRAGFVDGTPDKKLVDATGSLFHNQIGTKWSLDNTNLPPTALDHIMCGLERTSFSESGIDLTGSMRPYRPCFPEGYEEFETDHAVMFSRFEL